MKKQLTQEEKLLAAKAKSQAIADDILDEEEAQFIDGGPVDENGLPLDGEEAQLQLRRRKAINGGKKIYRKFSDEELLAGVMERLKV